MSLSRAIFPMRAALGALTLFISQPVYANNLENNVVNLAVGNWTHQQSVFISGQEIPQGALGGTECLREADSQLTVGQYLDKFVQGVGPDQTCSFSDFSGVGGDVTIDIVCTNPQGASTEMTLNYQYSRQNVAILGEGMMTAGGISSPIKVVATSRHLGACS